MGKRKEMGRKKKLLSSTGPAGEAADVVHQLHTSADEAPAPTRVGPHPERLVLVELARIRPSMENPRAIDEKSPGFLELVENVRAAGVLVPIQVRDFNRPDAAMAVLPYELLDGERRYRAALAAGLRDIPAIIHEGLSDEEAFEILFGANFLREDLTPLEQGKAVSILMEKHGGDLDAVAAHLGRSRKWVALRRRLAGLSKGWVKAIGDPNRFCRAWGVGHLEVIARHEPEIQERILKLIVEDWEEEFRDHSVQQLASLIDDEFTHLLTAAPWKLEDEIIIEGLPSSCGVCSRRSSAQADLFDLGKGQKDDRCLDENCWSRKMAAYLARRVGELRQEHPGLVLVGGAGCHIDGREKAFEEQLGAKPLGSWDYDEVKKTDTKAKPALVVDGAGTGHLKWIRPRSSAKAERATANAKPKSLKERRKVHGSKRRVHVLEALRQRLEKAEYADLPGRSTHNLLSLAVVIGTEDPLHCRIRDEWKEYKRLCGLKPSSEEAEAALWHMVREVLIGRITYGGGVTQCHVERGCVQDAPHVAQLIGVDLVDLEREAVDAIPEPKSWAELKADGTPAKAEKKSPKRSTEEGGLPGLRMHRDLALPRGLRLDGQDADPLHRM